MNNTLILQTQKNIIQIILNRPQAHNALDKQLIIDLTKQLYEIAHNPAIKVVIITGNGASFCAGADLQWLAKAPKQSEEENVQEARQLAELLSTLYQLPQITIAAVQGDAYGGGIGLIACCDIAIAASHAQFRFSEIKLNIAPAIISPYVIAAMGKRAAKHFFLTAQRFDALEAWQMGLLKQIIEPEHLQTKALEIAERLANSHAETLFVIKRLTYTEIDQTQIEQTIHNFVNLRQSAAVQDRLQTFLAKKHL